MARYISEQEHQLALVHIERLLVVCKVQSQQLAQARALLEEILYTRAAYGGQGALEDFVDEIRVRIRAFLAQGADVSEQPYSQDEAKEKALAWQLEVAEDVDNLSPAVRQTFNYFMERIKELETRVEILENNLEILRKLTPGI
jgi:hypothetical protein